MEEEGACSVFHFLTDDLYKGESDLLFIGEEADKNKANTVYELMDFLPPLH